jgi:hypothetical protein
MLNEPGGEATEVLLIGIVVGFLFKGGSLSLADAPTLKGTDAPALRTPAKISIPVIEAVIKLFLPEARPANFTSDKLTGFSTCFLNEYLMAESLQTGKQLKQATHLE